jgi:predicted glycosyltransferase
MKIKTLIYLHDTLGLGRLKRNLKIATALSSTFPEMSITIVTGSTRADYFDFPPRTKCLKLPSLNKIGDRSYSAREDEQNTKSVMRNRADILLNTIKDISPDIFIVDHSHLAMLDEMLPALKWNHKNNAKCINVFGMREIIDNPQKVIDQWSGQVAYDIFREHYDHILIYGDPNIFDSADIYNFPHDIISKVDYCGYVSDQPNEIPLSEPGNHKKRITVTIGGGEWYGDVIIRNYLKMLDQFKDEINFDSTILTGPSLPENYWNEFKEKSANLDITLHRFVPNTVYHLARSDLVIGTAGYNMITDILAHAHRAIV